MKKSLLAVAAMTAFAGAAQAQSSVTVYGILDVGYGMSNYSGLGGANAAATNGASTAGTATQKQSTAGFIQSAETTSRLGFKGSEDLGGGKSAVFTVEFGLTPNNNTVSGSPSAPANQTGTAGNALGYNRQSFLGLKDNKLGTLTIGNQYTPIFDVQSITDTAGNNNMVGNAVYSGNFQSGTGTYNNGNGPFGGNTYQSVNVDSGAYTTRLANSIKYQSARISGFAGQLYYGQSNQNTTASPTLTPYSAGYGGTQNNTAWGVNGDFVWNKLQVVAAYQNIKSIDQNVTVALSNTVNSVAATGTTLSNGTAGGTVNSYGLNASDNQTYAAVVYDFGILKAVYQYSNRKASSVVDSSYFTKRSANQIGVRSQLTPTISAFATYGLVNSAYFGNGALGSTQGANGRTFQLGVDYYLSKRTNLYALAGAVNQSSNGSTGATTTAIAATNGGVSVSANNYAVGVRHTF
jgi:predicted porin